MPGMKAIVLSSDELPPRLREMLGNKTIFVHSYYDGGLLLAPERDTYMPVCGMLAGDPAISVDDFLKFTREER
jgi:hypothetical protein